MGSLLLFWDVTVRGTLTTVFSHYLPTCPPPPFTLAIPHTGGALVIFTQKVSSILRVGLLVLIGKKSKSRSSTCPCFLPQKGRNLCALLLPVLHLFLSPMPITYVTATVFRKQKWILHLRVKKKYVNDKLNHSYTQQEADRWQGEVSPHLVCLKQLPTCVWGKVGGGRDSVRTTVGSGCDKGLMDGDGGTGGG